MRVSIRQLADYCGVSIGTIDRVLNNRPGVKKQTKERIEKAIDELGYTPNHLAKSLSLGKTSSIGVVLFNLNNLFFAQLSDAIVKEADARGYFAYLTLSEKSKEKEFACIKNLVARQVDGIILFSTNRDLEFTAYLSSCGVKVVTVMTGLTGFPSVRIDDYSAMADATSYIASKQYKRIVYISPPLSYRKDMNILVQEQRYEGFLHTVKKWSLEPIVIDHVHYLEAIDHLHVGDVKTAFLCSSDVYALDILRHFRLKGFVPPYHYGLMGFDNISILQNIEPSIATVSIPIEDVGREAIAMLVRAIEGEGEVMETLTLPYTIFPGQTIV